MPASLKGLHQFDHTEASRGAGCEGGGVLGDFGGCHCLPGGSGSTGGAVAGGLGLEDRAKARGVEGHVSREGLVGDALVHRVVGPDLGGKVGALLRGQFREAAAAADGADGGGGGVEGADGDAVRAGELAEGAVVGVVGRQEGLRVCVTYDRVRC